MDNPIPFDPGCDPEVDPFCIAIPSPLPPVVVVVGGGEAASIGSLGAVVSSLQGVVGSIKTLAGTIIAGIAQVLALASLIWTSILKPLLTAIQRLAQKIQAVIDKILKPMRDAIKAQRAAILDIYNRFIRPIILAIEKLRSIIHVLQLFHIHIFDQLDRTLAKIEGKLLAPIYAALYRINTLGNWVSFILNARLLIFRGLLLGSMKANQGGVFSTVWNAPPMGMNPLPYSDSKAGAPPTVASFTLFDATANTALVDNANVIATDPAASALLPRLTAPIAGAGAAALVTLQTYLAADTGVTL